MNELNLKTTRDSVYAAIDSEREYQDKAWPENAGVNAPVRTIAEELMLLQEYTKRAIALWTDTARANEPVELTPFFRKIGALAVRAMENHGAPGREGYGVFVPALSDDDIPF